MSRMSEKTDIKQLEPVRTTAPSVRQLDDAEFERIKTKVFSERRKLFELLKDR